MDFKKSFFTADKKMRNC